MSAKTPSHVGERLLRGDVFEPDCPSREVFRHVTSTWGTLALIALKPGTLRFGDLRRKVAGVSERMLSQTLKQLEGDGLVRRESFATVPPKVEYTLTDQGSKAAMLVEALANWAEDSVSMSTDQIIG